MIRAHLRPVINSPHHVSIDFSPGDAKTIGRSDQADVVLDEPSLSRIHARIRMGEDGAITVEDLDSTNGMFVNGARRQTAIVAPGDRIRLGLLEYRVEEESSSALAAIKRTIIRLPVSERPLVTADRAAIESLLAMSRDLMAFGDLQALLDRVLDRLQGLLSPDRSAILLLDRATGELRARAVRPPGAYTSVSEFASATAVREALAAREVLVCHDTRDDARLRDAASVALAGVRSALCVPLLGRAGPIGALYADQRADRAAFTPDQVDYAAAFAAHAAAALETAQLYDDREEHFRLSLEALAKAIDARDRYTAGHSERVTAYSLALARAMGVSPADLDVIRRAGMLHDIGKVGVPDRVLLKAGRLDAEERAVIESHVTIGFEMLRDLPFMKDALPVIRGHHERWDGGGYPDRLAGTAIHPHARLMAVADTFDAMTSARPYRDALPIDEAVRRVRIERGLQFDPGAVDAFDRAEPEVLDLLGRHAPPAGASQGEHAS